MKEDNVLGAFSEDHAVQLTGISHHQLRRWDRDGFFKPSFGFSNRRAAFSRVYSFRDIVSLRVLNDLRHEMGVSLQHLREVSKHLAHLGDSPWTAATLYVLGKRVVFDDPRTHERQEIVSGQRVLDIPLRVAISSTRKAVSDMNQRGAAVVGHVDRNRYVAENQAVFSGTRIPVATVQRYLAAGYTPAAIVKEYPSLTNADIEMAKNYLGEDAAA